MIWAFEYWTYWFGRTAMALCPVGCNREARFHRVFCDTCWAKLGPVMRDHVSRAWRSERWRAVLTQAAEALKVKS